MRGGLARSEFDETAEALYLTSGFVYDSAEQAEAAFKDEIDKFIYSRYGNPTVAMFEERLRLLEGAEACFATASGMAAVFTSLAALCAQGDRIVSSRALFGSCFVIIDEILPRWGVEAVFVDGPDLRPVARRLWPSRRPRSSSRRRATRCRSWSTSGPSCDLAHAAGAQVVVDNVFGTPVFSRPLEHGADIVVYSATKHIDGQGRALGGAILGPADYIDGPVKNLMRHTGPSMSPFNAWVMLKGLETLSMRVERQHQNALTVAAYLASHPRVARVLHPWLPTHPQHDLARRQMLGGGTVVTFGIDGGKAEAFAVMNALQIVDISNNLGDAKSLITHPATTTHRRLTARGARRRGDHRRDDPAVGRAGGPCATSSRTSPARWARSG